MKKSIKNKQASKGKGSQKISDFFSKVPNFPQNAQIVQNTLTSNKIESLSAVLTADGEDEGFVAQSTDHKTTRARCAEEQENLLDNPSSVNCNCIIEFPLKHIAKKRKVQEIDLNISPQESFKIADIVPSRSEYERPRTPTNVRPIIYVKTPEKLLSSQALKEYCTPEKKLESFLEKIRTPSPRKQLFDDGGSPKNSSLLSEANKITRETLKGLRKVSPKLVPAPKTPTPEKCKTDSASKVKRTPKKLFQRSPNNINEFNVQVIESFVQITPSKSNCNEFDDDVVFVRSSEKKQSSILKFMSSSPSPKSLQAQHENESTPQKSSNKKFKIPVTTPTAKVKTRLDFSDIHEPKSGNQKENSQNPSDTEEMVNVSKSEVSASSNDNLNLTACFDDSWCTEVGLLDVFDYSLDLTESQHCKIVGINPFSTKSILTLKSTSSDKKAVCNLEGFWMHAMLSIGDTVHVTAKKIGDTEWIINNDCGLLVYEPDLLISTTSVVGSIWCKRRNVLKERFRGFEPCSEAMLVGTLVHDILQTVLQNGISKKEEIEAYVKKLLKRSNVIKDVYECSLTLDHLESEILKFVPNIEKFISLYLENGKINANRMYNKYDWKGTIKMIDDIEENIWCPELGLKGKVDLSVKTDSQTMPLELKTGRATISLEHRGQVVMYIMMMNKLGYQVQSGLLLYIRDGVLREIPPGQKEKRDLILLRNELAYYLTRRPKITNIDTETTHLPPDLPEPINHPSCVKCPYSIVCTSYAKYCKEDLTLNTVLRDIQEEVLKSLSESHLNYFMKWISMLAIESDSSRLSKNVREIYTLPPAQRNINGRCIINLKTSYAGEECNGVYEHIFVKMDEGENVILFSNGITETNYVVVSTDTRPAVASGFVTNITNSSIYVTLDRNLNKKYAKQTFHIDSYDSSSIQTYNLASLAQLLELSPRAEKLRRIIIDKAPATFKDTLPKVLGKKGKTILKRLNVVQQRTVLRAIAAEDYFLIKGMPGTGKTATVVALIQLLYELGKSILITSHTNSAVDNVCLKLLNYDVKLMRLGSESKIDPKLKEYCELNLTKYCSTPEELEKVYNNTQIVAVTCMGSGHPVISKRIFDICVVDESTQVLQCSVIRPLYAAETFILIGDPDQLPAVVRNRKAREMGMSESLFERLCMKENMAALNLNYRMNTTITALANELTYNGELLIGSSVIAESTLNMPNIEEVSQSFKNKSDWLRNILDTSLEKAVQCIDTGSVWKLQHQVAWKIQEKAMSTDTEENPTKNLSNLNIYEAAIAVKLVNLLIEAGVQPCQIGVIATYKIQVTQISSLLRSQNVDVNTVDQFQGKDKNVIIYSCSKSEDKSKSATVDMFELLEDRRRITVAITRAKHKLIIIGDVSTVIHYSPFKKIIPFIEQNIIRLNNCEEFQWKSVLDL